MRSLDIERLLQWAYRDELIKRAISSAEGIWEQISNVANTGVAERMSGGSQRYDHGVPHPDAVAIEHAVARLPDVVIDWERDAQAVLGHLIALVEPRAEPVERSTSRSTQASWPAKGGSRRSHHLEPPREVILVRSVRTSALVTQHASMGTRPDWWDEHPHPSPVPALRGPNVLVVGTCIRKNWYSEGSYCVLRWWPSPITIAEARADYLGWYRGLVMLAQQLRLIDHVPLLPAAPEYPWHAVSS